MSHTWKLLPIAALFALGAFMLFTGTDAGRLQTASASEPQVSIDVDSNPEGGIGYQFEITVDGNNNEGEDCEDEFDNTTVTLDDDETATVVECDEDAADIDVTVSIEVPSHSELDSIECSGDTDSTIDDPDVQDDEGSVSMNIVNEEHITCEFVFNFDEDEVTPTVTATSTAGPAATIIVSSSNNNLGCGATSIVTITVRGANGQPVAAGTLVNIVANIGSVSPSSGQTTADGSVFVFYTAPNNQGGEATITAASGSALGTAEINVNCNVQPTQAPPPTATVGGGIQPPNTGDGGLSGGNGWQGYAGVALILSSVIATLAVIRQRA